MLMPPTVPTMRIIRGEERSHSALNGWRRVAAFGLPFALYILTLAPTVYNLDSAELATAAATGGLVRATGYPLYLLLGRVWSWLPIGDVGYRMNLFSALNGALTIALADRILQWLRVGPWAAFGALGLLACAPFFWALSAIAEVYTLHTALMAGLVLSLLRWCDRPTGIRLTLVTLLLGLAAGNHAATALLVPGCLWCVVTRWPERGRESVLHMLFPALAAFLLGLSVYLYLPFLHASKPGFNYVGNYDATGRFNPVDLQTLDGLLWLVSGQAFAGKMLAYRGVELWHQAVRFGMRLWRAFFAVGIGPGLLGMVVLVRRNWRLGGMLLWMFFCNAVFYIDYRVIDKDTMFLPTYLIWALWAGVGYQWLLDWVTDEPRDSTAGPWNEWVLRFVMVVAVLVALGWNWPLVDLSDDWSARARGEATLRIVGQDALVLGWWDTVPVIEYLQLVENRRLDVQAINRFLIAPGDMYQLIEREVTRRPVYIDSLPADLPATVKAESVGPVHRLVPRE